MAREVRRFAVTVSAGTTKAAPSVTEVAFPVRKLTRIDWHLPPGCATVVGFYVSMGKVQVQPLPAGTWIFGDGVSGSWPITDAPDSGAWEITAYNTGAFDHAIHLAFHVDLIERLAAMPTVIAAELLSEAPDLSHAGPPVIRRP